MAQRTITEFRAGLRALKRAGIVDVDVSKAQPYWVRSAGPKGGKYTLSELLNKYDDIVSGKATAVSVSPEELKKYKKVGYQETRGGKVVIPHAATEKVRVSGGKVRIEDIHGIQRVQVPVEYHNLEQYLRDLKKNEKEIDRMRRKGSRFAFRFYGGHSMTYSNMDLLLEDLEHYEAVMDAVNRRSSRDMNEVYRHLEIVEVDKRAWEKSKQAARDRAQAKRKEVSYAKRRERLKKNPAKFEASKAKKAEQEKRRRAKMTAAEKEKYRAAAKKRAKKARKKK